MKIIFGLGNPGPSYENTRHNAGFLALDYLAHTFFSGTWQEKKKLLAHILESTYQGEKILLVKPAVFMNDSGRSVRKVMDFYKVEPQDIVVLHDDLDITPGLIKTTSSSRAAGHNGIADIIDHLGTQDFKRLRIGIGRPTEVLGACQPSHDYVLGQFTADEKILLHTTFEKTLTTPETILP